MKKSGSEKFQSAQGNGEVNVEIPNLKSEIIGWLSEPQLETEKLKLINFKILYQNTYEHCKLILLFYYFCNIWRSFFIIYIYI